MARSDLLLTLIRAHNEGDQSLFIRTVEAIAAEERSKQHHIVADRLVEMLRYRSTRSSPPIPTRAHDRGSNYVSELIPRRALGTLILSQSLVESLNSLIEEQQRAELLRSYNIEPRNRVLLVGPPGNGKTSIAEGLAEALMTPFFTVHYEALIGSYLGETAQRLKSLFEYISSRECVLFLDEFDVLGKERGDIHETGEIKRVVSSLLLQMDALPTHVVVVAATNHPELLDRAVWRRFQLRLEVQPPDQNQFGQWLKLFRKTLPEKLPTSDEILRNHLMGLSFSELEDFRLDVLRRYILKIPEDSLSGIIRVVLKELALTVKPVIDEASLHGVS